MPPSHSAPRAKQAFLAISKQAEANADKGRQLLSRLLANLKGSLNSVQERNTCYLLGGGPSPDEVKKG